MLADIELSRPHRRRRQRAAYVLPLRVSLATLLAAVLVVVLGGVAHGGTSGGAIEHITVAPGDTVWSLAAAHQDGGDLRTEVDRIIDINHLDGGLVVPGQVLTIPPG